ncbi:SMI1/KNR4 family protein [Paenibacillus sp. FSL H8-0548]|uniref:SMI1/KNR4 family protein n=1 Tax=Paenibacillus sp. FSL H8-0548 TaxID=1920422 RepID=UPI0009F9C562|nr:SMI1/KNR4 family protein [Paenibacillus sp. FSL H8-0548]
MSELLSCLNALKIRLNQSDEKVILVQMEKGDLSRKTFSFNPPADTGMIHDFFKENNWNVPEDYAQFLREHDGATLFEDPKNGGGLELLSLKHILPYINDYGYMFPDHCYPIGFYNAAILMIDSEESKKSSEYMFWQSCYDKHDEKLNLRMNFETWFDLFIVSQGSEYWLWPTFKPPL